MVRTWSSSLSQSRWRPFFLRSLFLPIGIYHSPKKYCAFYRNFIEVLINSCAPDRKILANFALETSVLNFGGSLARPHRISPHACQAITLWTLNLFLSTTFPKRSFNPVVVLFLIILSWNYLLLEYSCDQSEEVLTLQN